MKRRLYALLFVVTLLNCETASEAGPPPEPRSIRDHITYVREPWADLCFAYIKGDNGFHRGWVGIANVPCEAIPKNVPVPTIPVYQYE